MPEGAARRHEVPRPVEALPPAERIPALSPRPPATKKKPAAGKRPFHRRGRNANQPNPAVEAAKLFAEDETCPRCGKPLALCICDTVEAVDNEVEVLILQHPQEQDKLLGTARLATVALAKATFRVGLSWPSLAKALGRRADASRWAILYLGGAEENEGGGKREITLVGRKGETIGDQGKALAGLEGIIVLDGTWSQAKTLWWRNPWVLKARRLILNPKKPSLYGKLRNEPRKEGLSTIESAGFALARIEGRPEIETALDEIFGRMLYRFRSELAERKAARRAAGMAEAGETPAAEDEGE
jgi:DTW domain-containing protein YfiP